MFLYEKRGRELFTQAPLWITPFVNYPLSKKKRAGGKGNVDSDGLVIEGVQVDRRQSKKLGQEWSTGEFALVEDGP